MSRARLYSGLVDRAVMLAEPMDSYTATSPMDSYSIDMDRRSRRSRSPSSESELLVRWTEAEIGGLNSQRLVTPSLIRYKSFDGLEIGAFVYRPHPKRREGHGKCPVVVHPHGGPEGQHRPLCR